jgi:nucleotide-binding universal stress UspA family protein
MNTFDVKKILIPIDFSPTSLRVVDQAAVIAKVLKAELVLLHVVENHWEKFSIVVPEMRIHPPEGLVNAIEKRLEDIAKNVFIASGVKSLCITSSGTIFSEVLYIAEEQKIDLIIMGTHGESGFTNLFIDSNAFKVVTGSTCPVISIQTPNPEAEFKNILLPIDDSAHSRQKVNHAIVMARAFGAQLHIVGLDNFYDDDELYRFELKIKQIEDYIQRCDLTYTQQIVRGNNQATITLSYAQAINADLIVIMTEQEENITGRLMGTYAQQIITQSSIPVMSIQPVNVIEN